MRILVIYNGVSINDIQSECIFPPHLNHGHYEQLFPDS